MFLGASVVAQGWSAYLGTLLSSSASRSPPAIGYGGTVDLVAILLVVCSALLITFGIKESLRVNMVLVGREALHRPVRHRRRASCSSTRQLRPFVPPRGADRGDVRATQPLLQSISGLEPTAFGVGGIFAGAALVFFAYIGFDVVATTAEETKNPQRDLPHRHHRLPRDLHRPVLRGRVRRDRDGALRRARPRRRRSPTRSCPRAGLDGDAHLRGRRRRPDDGRAHAADRRDAHHLRDVARRTAARRAREGAPQVPHAVASSRSSSRSSSRWSPGSPRSACSRRW